MVHKSPYSRIEDATRRYYGADADPLKLVPVVKNPAIAHIIATQVDRGLDSLAKKDFTEDTLRAQRTNRLSHGETDLNVLKEQAASHALALVVVNAELTHSRLAPEDWGEDAQDSLAWQMSNNTTLLPPPNPDDLRQ